MNRHVQGRSASPGYGGRVWYIDASASLQAVLDSSECPLLLRQTLTSVLSWQKRNQTPVQKALTSPRVAPQWVAGLLVLGCTVNVEEDAGRTETPLDVWLQQKNGGKITALHVPISAGHGRYMLARAARPGRPPGAGPSPLAPKRRSCHTGRPVFRPPTGRPAARPG